MFSNIPLPSIENNTIPKQMNALNELAVNAAKAKYAPMTVPAKALSELAYATFMQPQYTAKILENQRASANLTPEQLEMAKRIAFGAGTIPFPGNALSIQDLARGFMQNNQSPIDSLLGGAVNAVKKAFGFGGSQQGSQQPLNAMNQQPVTTSSPSVQPPPQQSVAPSSSQTDNSSFGYNYDKNGNNPPATDDEVERKIQEIERGYKNPTNRTYAENTAYAKQVEKEGEERGKQIGERIGEYGKEYRGALNLKNTFTNMQDILTTPTWQNMRAKIPYFQSTQLKNLSKVGTPEEQQMIGEFFATAKNAVRDTLNSFVGTRLKGELGISQDANINDNDTVDTAIGKVEAGHLFNELNGAYSYIVPKLMADLHIDESRALKEADKMINAKAIKKKIYDGFHPKITIQDPKTGKKVTLSIQEARAGGFKGV